MSSSSSLECGASKTDIDQSSYEVTDSPQDASLPTAINAINAAGAAHQADSNRSSSAFTSAQLPSSCDVSAQEALPEWKFTSEAQLLCRLPFLFQSVALQPRFDRAYSIYEKIPQGQIPQEIRGLDYAVENLEIIEKFLIARDKLVVWQAVATQSGVHEGCPEFAELNSLDDYLAKAAEFGDWLVGQPQALGIRELGIENAYLSSIPFEMGKLTQLRALNLNRNEIEKIEGLENLMQLECLVLSYNKIQRIEGLENLTKLKVLNFENNQIQKLEGLETLTQLIGLNFASNQIQEIEGLENLTKLKVLNFENNQIQKIEGLENLTQLEWLFLNNNKIQRIEGLENLAQLQKLNLSQNQIQRIEGLEDLMQLRLLNLGSNQIQKVEGLVPLTQLSSLHLGSNQIQKIEGLENLTQLQKLSLGYNQIQKLEGVEHLPDLDLFLGGNPIDS